MVFTVDSNYNFTGVSYKADASGSVSGTDMTMSMDIAVSYADWNATSVTLPDLGEWTAANTAAPSAIPTSQMQLSYGYEYQLTSIYSEEEGQYYTPAELGWNTSSFSLWSDNTAQITTDSEVLEASYQITDDSVILTQNKEDSILVPTAGGFYLDGGNGLYLIFE